MNSAEYKDIMQYAINLEMEAEIFYTKVSEKVNDPYLKEMFLKFSMEEKAHREILTRLMVKEETGQYFQPAHDYGISQTIERPRIKEDMTLADAFALAMKNEEYAMTMYKKMADDCSDSSLKKVFEDFAAMEQGHKQNMENFYTDVAYPEKW
ncbi:MAG: ferritin family protein [Desulfamplus sp.]|nr:ferritin family protein [Desulfamplus sp.]